MVVDSEKETRTVHRLDLVICIVKKSRISSKNWLCPFVQQPERLDRTQSPTMIHERKAKTNAFFITIPNSK